MSTAQDSPPVVRFGVFEADLASGELRRNGARVKIQDLPFRALVLLLSRPNEIVSREEFRQRLWPSDVFVDFDRGISSTLKRLRDALGDSPENPIFIETVERRGYRWIAPVHKEIVAAVQADVSAASHRPAPRWKWILAMPALALIFSIWMFRPIFRSAKAASAAPNLPSADGGFSHRAANHEAEDFYLQGRFYWNQRTPESLNKAVDSFTQAIVHDPNYAQAYVGLADCYNLLREYTAMPGSDAYPRALAAAKRAVELDDRSSDAHASLAFVSFYGMLDYETADREFRRAIELNPNSATAHHWYATYLSGMGRPQAVEEINRAQALDPSSKSILADKGRILDVAGNVEEGKSLLLQMESAEPDFLSPHRYLKYLYLEAADYPNYLAELKKEATLTKDSSESGVADAAEKGYAAGGGRGMLEAIRQQEKRLYDQGKFSPFLLAETCALLGNKKEAVEYLNVAYDVRADGIAGVEGHPPFNNLHYEPGFRELMARMHLPPLT